MVIKFKIFTPEEDDFLLEIEIDENSTFFDLHSAIIKACSYNQKEITSFYLSDKNWDYGTEILCTRFDEESQAESLIMEEIKLNHFSPEVGQRYLFVFDEIMQRGFFIEIVNIKKENKKNKLPKILISGKTPAQYENIEIESINGKKSNKINDDFDFDNFDDLDEFDNDYNDFDEYNEYDEYK